MKQDFWIYDWTRFRRDEVIEVPQDYTIHTDFIIVGEKSEIKTAFFQINLLYKNILADISEQLEAFGMPLHPKEKFRFFSQQWRDSGQAPFRPFVLLYNLFICGEMTDNAINISSTKFKSINKVKQIPFLFNKLTDYGFVFEGLKNNKVSDNDIIISYPDDFTLLRLFKLLADKAYNTNRLDDFLCCHFRLLQDDMYTANYGHGADDVADRVNTEVEKEFVYKMDETLISMGMFRKPYGGFECHGVAYYHTERQMNLKAPFSFRMVSRGWSMTDVPEVRLMLRIRNVSRCLDYLENCPDSVKEIIKRSDNGCSRRPCQHGVQYEFEGQSYYRCACCMPGFIFRPIISDIPHYIKLVELGEKK